MSDDPFELFGIERRFALDEAALRRAFLKASAEHHPDRFVDPIEQAEAVESMSRLTEAYRVLSDPESRARAMLAASGLELAEDRDKLPPELLMEVMEVREEMEHAVASVDHEEIERLRRWATQQRAGYLDRLDELFGPGFDQQQAASVRLTLNALRYIQRMLEQLPAG
ncbi:MAG: Fe-S protein assembly co-chaperone HscB [Planctomycetota bacterium]